MRFHFPAEHNRIWASEQEKNWEKSRSVRQIVARKGLWGRKGLFSRFWRALGGHRGPFGRPLGSLWEAFWQTFACLRAPRGSKRLPRGAKRSPRGAQEAPNRRQEASKTCPRALRGPLWEQILSQKTSRKLRVVSKDFFHVFWLSFCRFLKYILEIFLVYFLSNF